VRVQKSIVLGYDKKKKRNQKEKTTHREVRHAVVRKARRELLRTLEHALEVRQPPRLDVCGVVERVPRKGRHKEGPQKEEGLHVLRKKKKKKKKKQEKRKKRAIFGDFF
jgi:hypothetical protein